MKIRIKDNSIRYRLTKSEVDQLAGKGEVTGRTEFAPGSPVFYYRILSADVSEIVAKFDQKGITLNVPKDQTRAWAASDNVGMEQYQDIDDEASLRILIEKDFTCLQVRKEEDESDHFPNPLAEQSPV